MNVTGIVAEYNPFHNGHAYQIMEARKLTDCDYCVAVISGDFVQRGAAGGGGAAGKARPLERQYSL